MMANEKGIPDFIPDYLECILSLFQQNRNNGNYVGMSVAAGIFREFCDFTRSISGFGDKLQIIVRFRPRIRIDFIIAGA